MIALDLQSMKQSYERTGYLSGVEIIAGPAAARQRQAMEKAEAEFGPLHYKTKVHTILRSPFELATLPRVLDIVEHLVGPDILLYNAIYIVKDAGSKAHVSWHQDPTAEIAGRGASLE